MSFHQNYSIPKIFVRCTSRCFKGERHIYQNREGLSIISGEDNQEKLEIGLPQLDNDLYPLCVTLPTDQAV